MVIILLPILKKYYIVDNNSASIPVGHKLILIVTLSINSLIYERKYQNASIETFN